MSLIENFKNGKTTSIASNANVSINLGNGHSNINVTAKNVDIDTGCGNQNINVFATGDLNIDTGHCGEDVISAFVGGNANIVTREDDDYISLVCNGNFDIDAGKDHHECEDRGYSFTDNDTVTVVSSALEGQNRISTGKDDDIVTVIANNVDVEKGKGSLLMGALGNNYVVNSDASKNVIGFYGDNYEFNMKEGVSKDDVRTLDFWLKDGSDNHVVEMEDGSYKALKDMADDVKDSVDGENMTLTEYDAKHNASNVEYFKENFGDIFNKVTYVGEQTTTSCETVLLDSKTVTENTKEDLAKKYNLSDQEKAILDSVDLTATFKDGSPLYAIVPSPKKSKNGNTVYVIAKRDGTNSDGQYHYRALSDKECLKSKPKDTSTLSNKTTTTNLYETTAKTIVSDLFKNTGVKNVTINKNNGDLNAFITAYDGKAEINANNATNNESVRNIGIVGPYIDQIIKSSSTETTQSTEKIENIFGAIRAAAASANSPLILDTNKDGKVSASTGKGVDIDNDGKADGAATKGDKMLAMSDINGNGKIDGAEVFGNKTVSPFTGKELNAANGFEALKLIAKEAEQYTGAKVMDAKGNVDIQALKAALAKVGVNLGLISDDNTSSLESVADVASINVNDYMENAATGDIQNRQLGEYVDASGKKYSVNDVWFKKAQ